MARVALIAFLVSFVGSPALSQSILTPNNFTKTDADPKAEAELSSPAAGQSGDQLSFGSVIGELGRDFRALPSLQTGAILGAGGGLSAWVRSEDVEITHQWSASPVLDAAFEPGAILGSGWVQVGSAFGTYIIGRASNSPKTAALGSDLIRAQMINTVLTQGVKLAVRRQRPDGGQFSFPSGHTSATFTTATVLQRRFGWKAGIPAYTVGGFVGGSRLQENRHYLSDVLFGAAIGIVSGRTATLGRGKGSFAVSPLVAPGAIGIAMTHRSHPAGL